MSEVVERGESKIIISAKQVKTLLRCEYLYYLEYVQKKEYPKSEAMTLGLEVHERVSGPLIRGLSLEEAKEINKDDPFSRVVYSLLPKNGNPKVETKYFVDMGSYQRVVIPDFLYEDSIYDLKTTSSESAYKTVYSDDIIQLHYYWETLGGNRDAYIIKLLLPKGYGKSQVSSGQESTHGGTNYGGTNGNFGTAAYANLFKIKIGKEVIGDIHFAERRIMEILDGAKPIPSPGRVCRTCPFNQACPFSVYKPEPEPTV
jgi:CRISPR/Cas system-associated exonuclease Cas4 (RecB family)